MRTAVAVLAIAAVQGLAAEIEFNRDVRPILSENCFPCHGPDPANRKSALRFDSEQGSKAELRSKGHAIVPGDPAASELFQRVTSTSKAMRMPPAYAGKPKLSDHEIEVIRQWIEQGAKWQLHWAFIPPKRPAPPEVNDASWPKNPIDRFILSRLEHENLKPSPEADRATLLRRVSLDLTGLPPTPGEAAAFVNDSSA